MSNLAEIIAEEIRVRGAMPFARFMELALYCPVYGYYEKEEDNLGRRGDYYTSVSVGPLFGELLAFQFAEWLDGVVQSPKSGASLESSVFGLQSPDSSQQTDALRAAVLVEAGAHRGELAKDVLSWLSRYRPEIFERLEYWIVEPSSRRREWQRATLAGFAPRVRWAARPSEVGSPTRSTAASSTRIIFSNELLDAMPVHRFGWDARKQVWFEWGVTLEAGRFAWARLDKTECAGTGTPPQNF